MNITIEKRDLFTVPQGYYLAHCISADFALGAGIAKKFDEVYNMRFKLFKNYDNYEYEGGDALPVDNTFNLVTKKKCYHKPTYEIEKWGYDCKQLHHLFRIKEFMYRWINGESFERCLISVEPEWLVDVKKGKYNLEDARRYGKGSMDFIQEMYEGYLKTCDSTIDESIYRLFDEVSYNIIKIGVEKELNYDSHR